MKKIIAVTISYRQAREVEKLGIKMNMVRYVTGEDKEVNWSKIIQLMLICGYIRWKAGFEKYLEDIQKSKTQLFKNIFGDMPLPEDIYQQPVKIPEEFYDELEKMRNALKEPLKKNMHELWGVPLITMSPSGIKENKKKLAISDLTNIIISIETDKLDRAWSCLKEKKVALNVCFALPHYINLCRWMELCGLKKNEVRYLAMFSLFGDINKSTE